MAKCPKCETINPADSKFCKECATQLPLDGKGQISFTRTLETTPDELTRGMVFAGRYEIIEELGEGGMGKVYRAQDTKLNEEVALKLIKPEIAADKRTVERFHNEIKIARQISHKNVCRTHDLHQEGKTLFLTMEYVRGEDLKSLIHRTKTLSVGTALSIARQVAEGLGEAHKLGITHRDLKPGNIMIDKDGQAKIMDFGIARSLYSGGITAEGGIIGTPEYMSPEQVEGKPADPRADIYALGIILFEMVTGRVPFEGETPFSIANKQKSELPPVPKKLMPQIPEGLSRLILRCLEKDKAKRYQTADELIADIAVIEDALPTTEPVATRRRTITHREVTVKFQPRKLIIPITAVLVLAVAGFFLWRIVLRPKPAPGPAASGRPTIAVLAFENISGDANLDIYRGGLREMMITGLSQSRFINVLTGERVYGILKKLGLAEAKKYTAEELVRIAGEGRVSHLVTGSYLSAGGNVIITLTVQDPKTGKIFKRTNVECRQDLKEISAKADDLTLEVKRDLDLSREQLAQDSAIYKKIEEVTTSSPEALKYYQEGQKRFLNLEFQQAIAYFEKALEIDPGFAMAYRRISAAYTSVGNQVESWKNLRKALELREHLPEFERLLIEAQPFIKEQNYAKAIEIYERLAKLYPGHPGIYINWSVMTPDYDDKIRLGEIAVRGDRNQMAVTNLAEVYMLKGLYGKAEDLCRSYLLEVEESDPIRSSLSRSYLCRRQFDAACAEAEKIYLSSNRSPASLEFLGSSLYLKGDLVGAEKIFQQAFQANPAAGWENLAVLALARGKFSEAIRLAQQNLREAKDNKGREARAYNRVAEFLEKTGRYEEAFQAFSQYLRLSDQSRRSAGEGGLPYLPSVQRVDLFGKGRIQAKMKSLEEAKKTAEELKSVIDKGIDPRELCKYEHILGLIEFARKDYRKAAGYFESAVGRLPFESPDYSDHALHLDALARSFHEAGELDKARREFEKITLLTTGRYLDGDVYAKAFYMLGKIAEQQGDLPRARENYGKFLDLWKDADPGLPEVEDARKRLAAL